MELWSTECSECDWRGSVRIPDLIRGCPAKDGGGQRCGAPFATMPPRGPVSPPFYRSLTDLESGEMQLLFEWYRIPITSVRTPDGRLLISRPRPATWDDEEGERKAAALREILGRDPFPEPEGERVRAWTGGSPAPERAKPAPASPPDAAREAREEIHDALYPEDAGGTVDPEYWEALAESEPPPERR